MPKINLPVKIIIAGLIIIFIALALWVFSRNRGTGTRTNNTAATFPSAFPTQTELKKGTTLNFNPQKFTLKPQERFNVDVVLNNPGNQISGVDLKIIYDPGMLILSTPTPGNFFTNAVILDNTVDNKRGLVSVSLGSSTPASKSGTLVRLSGSVYSGVTGETDLIILPESKITWTGSGSSILEQTGQATISVLVL